MIYALKAASNSIPGSLHDVWKVETDTVTAVLIRWKDKVLTPSAYKASKGVGVAKVSENPYCWELSAVAAILENAAYIENAHTPIIDRKVWDKVQMIRENKHRPTKSG